MLPPLPESVSPEANALLDLLAEALDEGDLRVIASADRGEDREAHLAALHRLLRDGTLVPLRWEPREVLELTRWDRPSDDSVDERRHWRRAFACAGLLRSYGEPANHDCLEGANQTLISLMDSVRTLVNLPLRRPKRVLAERLDESAAAFLAWLIPRLPAEDFDEHAFFGLGLLWFALATEVPDAVLVALADWVMLAEDAAASPWRAEGMGGMPEPWLLSTTCFTQRHALWRSLGGRFPERLRGRHGPEVMSVVRLISVMLTPEPG